MSTGANIEEILSRPGSDIKAPQPKPVGTYHCVVDGPFKEDKIGKESTTVHDYSLKVMSIMGDVDAAQAAEQGVVGSSIRARFFLTEKAAYRLVEFLRDGLGIDDSKPLTQMEADAPGRQVLVKIRHVASQDGKRVFEEVENYARV